MNLSGLHAKLIPVVTLIGLSVLLVSCGYSIPIRTLESAEGWPVHHGTQEHPAAVESIRIPLGQDAIAVCLSGGGYRATLFHLGTLWMLNDAGLLPKVERIVGVSGGAIAAATVAANWADLNDLGFEDAVAVPLMSLASKTIDVPSIVIGALTPSTAAHQLATRLDNHVFEGARLADLPDVPVLVLLAVESRSSMKWAFSKHMILAERLPSFETAGPDSFVVPFPDFSLAHAVAASAGFPPFLAPLDVAVPDLSDLRHAGWAPGEIIDDSTLDIGEIVISKAPDVSALSDDDLHLRLQLIDGGVVSNTGAEYCLSSERFLISSASSLSKPRRAASGWLSLTAQTASLIHSRSESLQRDDYSHSRTDGCDEKGCRVIVDLYDEENDDPSHDLLAAMDQQLVQIDTRLKGLPENLVRVLVNWGYAAAKTQLFGSESGAAGLQIPFPQLTAPYCLPQFGETPPPTSMWDAVSREGPFRTNFSPEMIDLILEDRFGRTTRDGDCEGDWGTHHCTSSRDCRYFLGVGHCQVLSGPAAGEFGMASKLGGCLTFSDDLFPVQCEQPDADGEKCRVFRNLGCEVENDAGQLVRGRALEFNCVTEEKAVISCESFDDGEQAWGCRYFER